ncbi:HAP2A, partial [Symbiodinium sp. CCMP2592]
ALRAELVGDLAAAVAPHRFESKYLVVPQRPAGHERVTPSAPLQNAMLLDRSLFDLAGRTCDKIGVSYPAFRYQPEKCDRPSGSFQSGPKSLPGSVEAPAQPIPKSRTENERLSAANLGTAKTTLSAIVTSLTGVLGMRLFF